LVHCRGSASSGRLPIPANCSGKSWLHPTECFCANESRANAARTLGSAISDDPAARYSTYDSDPAPPSPTRQHAICAQSRPALLHALEYSGFCMRGSRRFHGNRTISDHAISPNLGSRHVSLAWRRPATPPTIPVSRARHRGASRTPKTDSWLDFCQQMVRTRLMDLRCADRWSR
jgi:hypothetical protein